MENSFSDFQRKRMIIFGELVKRYWNGRLNDVEDLNELTDEIKEQYGFRDEDRAFIMDHIRIAMGLDPTGEDVFRNELELVKNFNVVNKPVIARIDGPCEYCDENSRTCRDTCLFESHVYRRSQGPVIVNDKCVTCGRCVTACDFGALADKIEFIPVIELLKEKKIRFLLWLPLPLRDSLGMTLHWDSSAALLN
ncbi:4Fe-4S binding protein [Thermoclostridium stercorarium]|uniref:4Fe-4S binding protein n=1 Tax=Thermoclostridium stercorarium TaxID=1510 RepID=UPI000A88B659|nr:4Fe-4S binding protein [Thermoclostridium stercorarium]